MSISIDFEGTCDVCGEPLTFTHDFAIPGMIDYAFDDLHMITSIRHIAGPDDGCQIYSSRVRSVKPVLFPESEPISPFEPN